MGASREVTFSALAEPALFLGLAALARQTESLSLTSILAAISTGMWMRAAPALGLTIGALSVVFLAENARIPVDDPTTHLELTMIHEVMMLDHSGPDFAMIQYAAALKMWLLGATCQRRSNSISWPEQKYISEKHKKAPRGGLLVLEPQVPEVWSGWSAARARRLLCLRRKLSVANC